MLIDWIKEDTLRAYKYILRERRIYDHAYFFLFPQYQKGADKHIEECDRGLLTHSRATWRSYAATVTTKTPCWEPSSLYRSKKTMSCPTALGPSWNFSGKGGSRTTDGLYPNHWTLLCHVELHSSLISGLAHHSDVNHLAIPTLKSMA